MLQTPKSLTAVVHVKFHYKEPEMKSVSEGEIEMVSRMLNHASEMPVEYQEILIKFADHLKQFAGKTSRQRPAK